MKEEDEEECATVEEDEERLAYAIEEKESSKVRFVAQIQMKNKSSSQLPGPRRAHPTGTSPVRACHLLSPPVHGTPLVFGTWRSLSTMVTVPFLMKEEGRGEGV